MKDKIYFNKTMVNFVKDSINPENFGSKEVRSLVKYANALSQKPRLGHIIPCDENDVPLVEPIDFQFFMQGIGGHIDVTYQEYKQYQKACESVLFEGFKFYNSISDFTNQKEPDSEFAVFNYSENKLAFSFYKKGTGFHTFLSIETFEDLANAKKNIPLTELGEKFFGYKND